jgi:type IV secretion system protein VirB10
MAGHVPPLDPRIANAPTPAAEGPAEAGIRPVVALPRSGLSGAALAGLMALAAILLFIVLDSGRRAQEEPAAQVAAAEGLPTAAPPPLYIPPTAGAGQAMVVPVPVQRPVPTVQPRVVYRPAATVTRVQDPYPAPRYYPPAIPPAEPTPPPPRVSNSPAVVLDTGAAPAGAAVERAVQIDGGGGAPFGGGQSGARVRSGVLANRSATVVQGTLIPAVLETAFDSRRPGFARAIVSQDVRGFDGSRVLVPRGSRLIGEYRSDIQPGQRRALINWTRLIRPDGVTIAIASPAADTLGRGGVRGDYDSHFVERFADAVLQSVLQVGVNAASRAAASGVIVALPGSTQNTSVPSNASRIGPTLKVKAGTSIGVFVARDLDFSAADRAR